MYAYKKRPTWNPLSCLGLLAIAFSGCSTGAEPDLSNPDDQSAEDQSIRSDTIEFVSEIDLVGVWHPPSDAGSVSVKVGIFLNALEGGSVIPRVNTLMRSSNILAQCDIRLELEVAQVISLPPRLRSVQGNEAGSWGGHPPPGTENPALFNYQENNRLTQETRELFAYGKRYTSPNAIAVFVVEEIVYYWGGPRGSVSLVGGLSFAPNLYHQIDDYPLRNSVLLNPRPWSNAVAHELGHMLLNAGLHNDVDPFNLMNGLGMIEWTVLTAEQCDRMRDVQGRLYGEEEVHDPGPPSS